MSSIASRVQDILQEIAQAAATAGRNAGEITLLAATKTRDAATVREVIASGVTTVGENRVQEMTEKLAQDAYDGAQLHFIGRLQSNKVRQVAGKTVLIHSVDSLRIAREIDRVMASLAAQGAQPPVQDVLAEVNIAGEQSKGGVAPQELDAFLDELAALAHIRTVGLMCIPPPADTPDDARRCFARMKSLFDGCVHRFAPDCRPVLSMGMSGDYVQAVLEGATLVRVGTAIFGQRQY
ncbi:MAG: YggS family pyridoxal phosphate-dependent enzyme [Acetanaerobacterium sp.]